MSVLISIKFPCDSARFRNALVTDKEYFVKFGDLGRSMGRIHHRIAIGDGFVLVVDEWDALEHFHGFFASPELQRFIRAVGTSTSPSSITIAEVVTSPAEH